jgi:hypothetical protein
VGIALRQLRSLKKKLVPKIPFYVYKANDETLNPDLPSFVFCTSTLKAQMGLKMD